METLIQLKNNQFLMGLCRSGPPPDLQYDNSSGSNLLLFSFFIIYTLKLIYFRISNFLICCNLMCHFRPQSSTASPPLLASQLQESQSEVWQGQGGFTLVWATVCSVSGVTWPQRAGRLETVRQRSTDSFLPPAPSSRASHPQPICSPPHTLPSPLSASPQLYQ